MTDDDENAETARMVPRFPRPRPAPAQQPLADKPPETPTEAQGQPQGQVQGGNPSTGDPALDTLIDEFLRGSSPAVSWVERRKAMHSDLLTEAEITKEWRGEKDWATARELAFKVSMLFMETPTQVCVAVLGILADIAAKVQGVCPRCMAEEILYWAMQAGDKGIAASIAEETKAKMSHTIA